MPPRSPRAKERRHDRDPEDRENRAISPLERPHLGGCEARPERANRPDDVEGIKKEDDEGEGARQEAVHREGEDEAEAEREEDEARPERGPLAECHRVRPRT